MTRDTEELLVDVLSELLHELRALRRAREESEHTRRLADTRARRWGYPPPRRGPARS
jgi:hypothetical protein